MDKSLEMVGVDPLVIGIISKEQVVDDISFGHHLIELGNWHQMIIYNGLTKWLGSKELTSFLQHN